MKKLKVFIIAIIFSCSLFLVPSASAKTISSGSYKIRVYNQNDERVISATHSGWGSTYHFSYSSSGLNNVKSIGFLVQLPQPLLNDTYYDFEFDCTIISASNYERVNFDGYDVSGWEQYIGKAKFGVDQDDNHVIGYLERGYVTSNYVDSVMIRLYLADGYYGSFDVCLNSFSYNVNGTAAGFDEIDTVITSGISSVNTNVGAVSSQVESLAYDLQSYNSTVSDGLSDVNDSITTGVASVNAGLLSGFSSVTGVVDAGISSIITKLESNESNILSFFDSLFYFDLNGEKHSYIEAMDRSLLLMWSSITGSIEPAVNNINNNVALLNSSVLNGFNTINRDIQEQMIAQTTNILNAVAQQTNSLNSSILHMETAIIDKLDETLNLDENDSIVSDNDSINSELDSTVTDYDDLEKGFVDNFNDSLDDIDVDSATSIYSQNDFIRSAQFVSTNMQNIYDSNDFIGGMIDFTLLLGLIFTVLGISLARR